MFWVCEPVDPLDLVASSSSPTDVPASGTANSLSDRSLAKASGSVRISGFHCVEGCRIYDRLDGIFEVESVRGLSTTDAESIRRGLSVCAFASDAYSAAPKKHIIAANLLRLDLQRFTS